MSNFFKKDEAHLSIVISMNPSNVGNSKAYLVFVIALYIHFIFKMTINTPSSSYHGGIDHF